MSAAYISIGTNIDRQVNLRRALAELRRQFGALCVSKVYESPAVGFDGPPFLNLAAGFDTDLGPSDVVAALRRIEDQCGRDREQPRFSSRSMDIDLLLLGERRGDFDGVLLPRPEITDSAFVLVPLAELIPDAVHPVSKESYRRLLDDLAVGDSDIWEVELPL